MTPVTLVLGGTAAQREALIAANVSRATDTAAILEGLPSGGSSPLQISNTLQIHRIAPGCLCCSGNLIMRVTLNRLLRRPPARLFISVANSEHIEQLRAFLASPQYRALLKPEPDLHTC